MPIYGDLGTITLADLFQWIDLNRKTGILQVACEGEMRQIEFHKGHVISCASDDPSAQFGPFLAGRGKVSQEQLDAAQTCYDSQGQRLGLILLKLGALTEPEVVHNVTAHIEENVQSLFDWESAMFRFYEGATLEPDHVEVRIPANEVLLRGTEYKEELDKYRKVFESSGVVLRHTEQPPPEELLNREASRGIYGAINGELSIGEILRDAPVSKLLVMKLLHRIYQMGLVEVVDVKPVDPSSLTMLDRPEQQQQPPRWSSEVWEDADGKPGTDLSQWASAELATELARRFLQRDETAGVRHLVQACRRAGMVSAELNQLDEQLDQPEQAEQAEPATSEMPAMELGSEPTIEIVETAEP